MVESGYAGHTHTRRTGNRTLPKTRAPSLGDENHRTCTANILGTESIKLVEGQETHIVRPTLEEASQQRDPAIVGCEYGNPSIKTSRYPSRCLHLEQYYVHGHSELHQSG